MWHIAGYRWPNAQDRGSQLRHVSCSMATPMHLLQVRDPKMRHLGVECLSKLPPELSHYMAKETTSWLLADLMTPMCRTASSCVCTNKNIQVRNILLDSRSWLRTGFGHLKQLRGASREHGSEAAITKILKCFPCQLAVIMLCVRNRTPCHILDIYIYKTYIVCTIVWNK